MGVSGAFVYKIEKLRELGATPVEIAHVWERTKGDPDDAHIYEALKEINPELAERFFREMQLVVWRSDMRREPFNKRRIVASLLRETGISRGLAEKIAKEVEEKVRNSGLRVITSSFIRELVLARLIELGLEDIHTQYMRLGVPIYDVQQWLEGGGAEEKILCAIYTQYVLLHVLPRRAAELFLEGVWREAGMRKIDVPYASAYVSSLPNVRRWLSGLFKYLMERRFVDRPSIYVPAHIYEDVREVVLSIPGAILWSDEGLEGIKPSKNPVYSFGSVDAKVVRSLFIIDAERLANIVKTVDEFKKYVEDIAAGISAYKEFKSKLVKHGEDCMVLKNINDAANRLMIDRKNLINMFSDLPATLV